MAGNFFNMSPALGCDFLWPCKSLVLHFIGGNVEIVITNTATVKIVMQIFRDIFH